MQGPEILIPLISIVGFFSSIIIWVFLHYNTRYKERMALLEYGKDAVVFKPHQTRRNNSLKIGIVSFMVGLGIFIGDILEGLGMMSVPAYGSMILLMGGIGLVGYYFLMEKQLKKGASSSSDTL